MSVYTRKQEDDQEALVCSTCFWVSQFDISIKPKRRSQCILRRGGVTGGQEVSIQGWGRWKGG